MANEISFGEYARAAHAYLSKDISIANSGSHQDDAVLKFSDGAIIGGRVSKNDSSQNVIDTSTYQYQDDPGKVSEQILKAFQKDLGLKDDAFNRVKENFSGIFDDKVNMVPGSAPLTARQICVLDSFRSQFKNLNGAGQVNSAKKPDGVGQVNSAKNPDEASQEDSAAVDACAWGSFSPAETVILSNDGSLKGSLDTLNENLETLKDYGAAEFAKACSAHLNDEAKTKFQCTMLATLNAVQDAYADMSSRLVEMINGKDKQSKDEQSLKIIHQLIEKVDVRMCAAGRMIDQFSALKDAETLGKVVAAYAAIVSKCLMDESGGNAAKTETLVDKLDAMPLLAKMARLEAGEIDIATDEELDSLKQSLAGMSEKVETLLNDGAFTMAEAHAVRSFGAEVKSLSDKIKGIQAARSDEDVALKRLKKNAEFLNRDDVKRFLKAFNDEFEGIEDYVPRDHSAYDSFCEYVEKLSAFIKLIGDLKSKDPGKRAEAKKQLEDLRNEVLDVNPVQKFLTLVKDFMTGKTALRFFPETHARHNEIRQWIEERISSFTSLFGKYYDAFGLQPIDRLVDKFLMYDEMRQKLSFGNGGSAFEQVMSKKHDIVSRMQAALLTGNPDFACRELSVRNFTGKIALDKGCTNQTFTGTWKDPTTGKRKKRILKPIGIAQQGLFRADLLQADVGLASVRVENVNMNIASRKAAGLLGVDTAIVDSGVVTDKGGVAYLAMEVAEGASGDAIIFVVGKAVKPGATNRAISDENASDYVKSFMELDANKRTQVNEELSRRCNELEWVDYLTGQMDRNPGNYMIALPDENSTRVRVTGIDNDLAFPSYRTGLYKFEIPMSSAKGKEIKALLANGSSSDLLPNGVKKDGEENGNGKYLLDIEQIEDEDVKEKICAIIMGKIGTGSSLRRFERLAAKRPAFISKSMLNRITVLDQKLNGSSEDARDAYIKEHFGSMLTEEQVYALCARVRDMVEFIAKERKLNESFVIDDGEKGGPSDLTTKAMLSNGAIFPLIFMVNWEIGHCTQEIELYAAKK